MTPTDRAIEEIRKRRSVRTPILAALLDLEDAEVDALLAEPLGRGALIGCDVEVGGATVKEYRCSLNGGGALADAFITYTRNGRKADPVKARLAEWRQPKPSTPEASAGVALPAPLRPAAPRAVDSPKEEVMANEKPLAERIVDALKKHGKLNLDQLAKHASTTKGTLYTMMGSLVKNHGVRRVAGERGSYEIGNATALRDAPARAAPPINGSPYAGVRADLNAKKTAMLLDLTKLEAAIQAIEALG